MQQLAKKAKKPPVKTVKKRVKKTVKKHAQVTELSNIPTFFPQVFNILPDHLFNPRIVHMLSFCTSSINQQAHFIRNYSKKPFTTAKCTGNTDFWSPTTSSELGKAVASIRKARWLFKILLHHWRYQRITPSNTDDIVTLQSPRHAVYIVDWKTRSKYVFEASTLARDFMERLLCHDGLWEDCQLPRNPYTNLPLTLSQLISIYQQLSQSPVSLGWAISAFRKVRYDIKRFSLEYSTAIKLHAYRTTMRNTSHIDYYDRMIDFIEYAYDQESIDCLTTTYLYILRHFPTNPILKVWADLCFQFYEAPILYSGNAEGIQKLQNLILVQTVPLLHRQDELKQLRFMHLRLTPASS